MSAQEGHMTALSPSDLAMFAKIGVGPDLLTMAKVRRVNDGEARELLALNGASGDMAGIFFPYNNWKTGYRHTGRVRRDNPEIEDGKPKNKYMSGYGDRRHLYFAPSATAELEDTTIPIIVVEAEKSVLAITALTERTGKRLLPVATGGCFGWRGRIGKTDGPNGERVDEVGPLPDLEVCKGRSVYVLFDSNAATNPKVQHARRELIKALRKIKADAHLLHLPASENVNGPDDFIAAKGDAAFLALFQSELIVDKDGKVRGLLSNAITMLRESAEWNGVLAFNEFTLYITTERPAPWQQRAGANWTDYDNSRTTEWLQRHDVLINTPVTAEAVQTVARENRFHPVRDYLQDLKWDRTPRLETWLTDYLGAADSPFLRAVGPRWLVSAVARIFQPGCQCDHTLLLEGPQGIRKSTALQTLAGDEWFTDHISDLGGKDSRIELHGKWIIEFSELAAVRRGELERVKAFLTARIDNFRAPYARCCEAVPRSCVFAASVNDVTPFTDPTGSRRFWPVRCGRINIEALKADRNELWAEAAARYESGEVWWLDTDELNEAATLEQDQRYAPGPWDEEILEWLKNPIARMVDGTQDGDVITPPFHSSASRVTVADILIHVVHKPIDRWDQKDANQVVRCLTHAGWERKQMRTGPRTDDRRSWFYVSPSGVGHQSGHQSGHQFQVNEE
jgi:predicted P-loop ATPase